MSKSTTSAAKKVFKNKECVKYIKQFYDDMKSAMPGLMSYRYQTQVFGECVNSLGKPLDGYGDKENTIIAKAIPIMDVSKLKDVFAQSFNNGNFQVSSSSFSYSHCIVDLNPSESTGVSNTQFPMSFANGVNVNVDDYKTSKIVLQRIDKISGEKFDTFTMGSHATDYDLIVDSKKRKYKDE